MRRTKNLLWIWFIITLLVSIGTVGISVSADPAVLSAPTIIDETLTPQPTTTIRPTADGVNTAWTGSYADWDEATQNGDTDYVSATTLMLTESSELEDPVHQPWDIARVRVIAYARNTDPTSDEELVFILVVDGMTYWADYPAWPKPGYTLTTSYEEYTWEWGKNPATGDHWTWSDIDALEAGVESKASADYIWTGEIRVTQLYVEVEGPRLTVDIAVSNVEDLWGYSIILDYDTTILTATSYTSYDPYTFAWPSEINDTAGYVSVSYSKPTGQPGESGSMPLLRITFLVEGIGETDLDLHDTKLSNSVPAYISHNVTDGYFSNSPPTTHTLVVDSSPISGIEFTVDGTDHTTPWSDSLPEETYTVVMPSTWGIYNFDHWEDTSTNPSRTISLTGDTTITAYYVKRQWTLTVNSDPIDGVDFTLDGAAYTTPWSSLLDEGSYTVVMPSTWTVDTDVYNFDHWEDASTDPTRVVSLASDVSITAYYELAPKYWTLTVDSDPITGVEFTLDDVSQTTPYSASLTEGSYTVVMPSSWGIYNFDHWEDASTNPSRTISLTGDTTITAYYVKRQWTLTVNSDPISGIDFTVDGITHATSWSGLLDEGDHTIVMPSSFDVYTFDHWENDSTDPTRTISLTEDTMVTATYELYVPAIGWIEGTVTDAMSALPIEGVTVTADGYSANTNASGYYKIEVPAPATYDVTAEVANYFSGIVTDVFVDVEATERADFALTPMKHDVAVTGVSVVSEAFQGDIVTINVDVANLGDYDEVFDVSVTYDTTHIETKSVGLTSGDSTTVSFDWDTQVVAPDTYDITSEAILVGDADPTNNIATATIIIKPPPMHDIAVTSVVPSSFEVAVGGSIDIDVTIENQGTAEDSFTVNVYAGVDLVGSTISTLSAGASHTFTFTWTTTVEGDFLIKAEVPAIPDEEDLTDNILEDGTVTVTAAPPILVATVEIKPGTLNLRSNGRWITCYVQLPEGFDAEDIDVSTIRLEDVIPAEWAVVENSVLIVKFDRAAVINYIRDVLGTTNGEVTLTVTGKLVGGTPFEGSDTIIVISRGKGSR